MFATFKGKGRKTGAYLIPDGPLRGYKNYESKIHSLESYLYRKDIIIIAMIIQVSFFLFK